MRLRYQFVVLNKEKGKQLGLGVKCFENHTSLLPEVAKDIIKEFHKIDVERDEILRKSAKNQYFNIYPFRHLEGIPTNIIKQAELRLPLKDKQIAFFEKLKFSYDEKQWLDLLNQIMSTYYFFIYSVIYITNHHFIKLYNQRKNKSG